MDTADNDPTDYNGHGSHVAGTIAAVGNNSTGVTGVMWQAKIIPLRFLGVDGTGATSDAISAILYANANGAHVINNSWGGTGFSTPLKAAIDASSAVVVCAAGNGGLDGIGDDNDSTPFYPASYDSANIIAVAATDRNDDIASYSNFGLTSVDLAAPGHIIYSALPSLSTVPDPLPNGVLYSEDFDSTSGDLPVLGWSRGGTQSTWAVTTGTGNSSTNSLEDSPSADYENNTDSWAGYMTPFNSLKNNRFTLSFDWKGTIENGQDYLYINYSSDGISWNSADSITGSALNFTSFSTEITEATEPLDSVYIGFGLNSDSSVVGQGVFIDDVVLQRETISISSYSYANKNGTSMASPHVSGVAGLIKALNSSCSTAQIKSLILDNTENVVSLSGKAVTEGRLNAFNALSAVQCAQPAPSSSGGGGGGGCFIATAAYGSIMHPYVKELRNFRDRYLLTNVLGRQFVTFYYKYSPAAADMIRNRELLKVTVRIMLLPIVMLVAFPYISLITFIAFTVTSMFLVRTYKMRMNIRSGLDRNKL
jgi:subtilisin family serine protease